MLSKGQNGVIDVGGWNDLGEYTNSNLVDTTVNFTRTFEGAGTGLYSSRFYVSRNSGSGSLSVSLDGTVIASQTFGATGEDTFSGNFSIPTPGAHTLTFTINGNSGTRFNFNGASYDYYASLHFKAGLLPTKGYFIPNDEKALGELGFGILFGKNDNNNNYNKYFVGVETNTATTGNITPGNFVGYLDVGGYKIPYYK